MKKILVHLLKKYQKNISPFLKKNGYKCLFNPSCSEYAFLCLKKYNLFKAIPLIFGRLLSCNPINAYLKNNIKGVSYGERI